MLEIFDAICRSHTIEKVVYKLSSYVKSEDLEDVIQDLYLTVYSLPEEKLRDLYAQGESALLNYTASVCIYNMTNKQSVLLKQYDYDKIGKKCFIEDLMRKEVENGLTI